MTQCYKYKLNTSMPDAWNPAQYQRFADERAQPFYDLLALVAPVHRMRAVDLGCGPGSLTKLAAEHLDVAEMTGTDNSPKMMAQAMPLQTEHLHFSLGDIGHWTAGADYDLVMANASLQWVPDHRFVLGQWTRALRAGGQLAVQVPANHDYPSHTVSAALAREEPYRSWFVGHDVGDPVAANVLSPQSYAELLDILGYVQQSVRLQVYGHRLQSTNDVVEWVRGTSLTRFQKLLSAEQFEQFVDEYTRRLVGELGDRSPFFYPFKRILMWGRLG